MNGTTNRAMSGTDSVTTDAKRQPSQREVEHERFLDALNRQSQASST
ncbi:hypothetical protein VSR82_25070 [Burkholderia sp. JPY481]